MYRDSPDEASLSAAIVEHSARYVVVGSVKYVGTLYDTLPRGGVIARFGVGHDGIDKQKATAAGVFCTNTPGVLDESVAELAILLLLAAARRLPDLTAEMRAGTWALGPAGIELRGKTLAVIGSGRIGQATARIATLGFGMRAIGCRRTPVIGDTTPFQSVTTDFGSAVSEADFVSLHLNAEPANHRFVDRTRLAQIPRRAWLINTARGSVVDEQALYDALASQRLAGAALDVFDRAVRAGRSVARPAHVAERRARAARRQPHHRSEPGDGRACAAECDAGRSGRLSPDGYCES